MNSVHEPGPNGDSKISSSRKTVQKAKPDAQAPSKPIRHAQVRTGAPRREHGCRIVAVSPVVSWQGVGRVAGQRGRIAATVPLTPRASACAPAPSASACSPSTLARSAYRAPSAVSWPPSRSYRRAQRRVAARPWPYRGRELAPGLRLACPAPQYNIFVLQPQKLA